MNISTICTKEDAIAAIEAVEIPKAGEKESPEHKADKEQQAALISAAKEFIKARVSAVPTGVKVIGLEARATAGPLEMFSLRIIQHK